MVKGRGRGQIEPDMRDFRAKNRVSLNLSLSQTESGGSLLCPLFRLRGFAWAARILPVPGELFLHLLDEFWRSVGPDGEVDLLDNSQSSC
jgi:hypothetical protein